MKTNSSILTSFLAKANQIVIIINFHHFFFLAAPFSGWRPLPFFVCVAYDFVGTDAEQADDGAFTAICNVNITIRDVNNHAPKFVRDNYMTSIAENTPIGMLTCIQYYYVLLLLLLYVRINTPIFEVQLL